MIKVFFVPVAIPVPQFYFSKLQSEEVRSVDCDTLLSLYYPSYRHRLLKKHILSSTRYPHTNVNTTRIFCQWRHFSTPSRVETTFHSHSSKNAIVGLLHRYKRGSKSWGCFYFKNWPLSNVLFSKYELFKISLIYILSFDTKHLSAKQLFD